jgi:branched-chain amino acid transport system ATP-binding protein
VSANGTRLLELGGVAKHFGGLYALSGLDLHVDEGEIVSVIGPNGAGKSTMFNVVTGLYPPDDGDVRFKGDSIVGLAPNRITKLGLARTFQTVHLFPNMTVLENAMVGQHCRGKSGVFGSVIRLPARAARRSRSAPEPRRPSSSSGSAFRAIGRTSRRSRSPTPTAGGWRWRARSRRTPSSSCSTSRRPG